MTTPSDAARALRAIPSAIRSEASRENGKKGGRPRTSTTPKCHRDGTVSYWSVYEQQWRVRVHGVPDRELAAMSAEERERVMRHLGESR